VTDGRISRGRRWSCRCTTWRARSSRDRADPGSGTCTPLVAAAS